MSISQTATIEPQFVLLSFLKGRINLVADLYQSTPHLWVEGSVNAPFYSIFYFNNKFIIITTTTITITITFHKT